MNDNPGFAEAWQLVQWTVPSVNHNDNQSAVSCGIWVAQGDQIANTISFTNGQWRQTSTVVAGRAKGASVSQTVQASSFFCSAGNAAFTANFFILESELYGDNISAWSFPVQFTNVSITAQTSTGVSALCGSQKTFSDGNGNATLAGYSVSSDGRTCKWTNVTLLPP
ncbi:hypothetical protein DACRYDRAFT_24199 [Dacryopinax primogenitus]|uniref:Concanavalin A-like lectin/glucanase n=1 Tax=Dacryopinax primogenitus (strain DJM 731) TaxID=1858805 RepID=M5G497_DACPD|nr:uncharacterized protein DACRYDRAFT_24199 [Dacryopinax primogenitus]EJT98572.1 hypothetical protein DACRYDRAFT_24199 [Dacryopinax primogenitus]